jgi:hypothetical protein
MLLPANVSSSIYAVLIKEVVNEVTMIKVTIITTATIQNGGSNDDISSKLLHHYRELYSGQTSDSELLRFNDYAEKRYVLALVSATGGTVMPKSSTEALKLGITNNSIDRIQLSTWNILSFKMLFVFIHFLHIWLIFFNIERKIISLCFRKSR